jgi:hypothetical protein
MFTVILFLFSAPASPNTVSQAGQGLGPQDTSQEPGPKRARRVRSPVTAGALGLTVGLGVYFLISVIDPTHGPAASGSNGTAVSTSVSGALFKTPCD